MYECLLHNINSPDYDGRYYGWNGTSQYNEKESSKEYSEGGLFAENSVGQ
jgi:hypothetical protein